jgi:hypothetical protein
MRMQKNEMLEYEILESLFKAEFRQLYVRLWSAMTWCQPRRHHSSEGCWFQILQVLQEAGRVNQDIVDSVRKYIAASQIRPDGTFLTPQSCAGTDHTYIARVVWTKFHSSQSHSVVPAGKYRESIFRYTMHLSYHVLKIHCTRSSSCCVSVSHYLWIDEVPLNNAGDKSSTWHFAARIF